jgi:ATP-dependent Clp protease ATP-binding subunit ClpX
MAYLHICRLKDHFLRHIPLDELPPKSNVLMVGPTGCGKSYLTELLFGQILQIPVVTVDMTGFVETGYVGKYVSEILSDILSAAKGNPHWAQMGICVLDEFDKLAGAGSNIKFGGGRTSKDITGYGVQRSLLKLIDGGKHEVSSKGPWGQQALETDCIGFVACGAFSGMENLVVRKNNNTFGFGASRKQIPSDNDGNELKSDTVASVDVFSQYGFLPELIGRFSSITHLNPLSKKYLMAILKKTVLPKYKEEFKREGQKLSLPRKVMESIIDMAIKRKTGARGIAFLLTEYFENQAFECFGQNSQKQGNYADIPF